MITTQTTSCGRIPQAHIQQNRIEQHNEKESPAVVKAVRYFRSYLERAKFKLYRDRESLTHLMAEIKRKAPGSPGVQQQFDF